MLRLLRSSLASALLLSCAALPIATGAEYQLEQGSPQLKHAGPLAFGPDGILLVGDSISASVFALDTGDSAKKDAPEAINVKAINRQIADMIGTDLKDAVINDMAVNPASGNIYLSVSRGRGPDATPLIFSAHSDGTIKELNMENIAFSKATFDNAPDSALDRRGRNPRMSAITDIQFNDGKVIVAGLSNEEFASKLRVLDFPFNGEDASTSIEVYHGAHGKLETQSPVRTFITYENNVLAAYTCTPLVTIPIDDLNGEKIMGKTVAELGNRNNPLDMIIYTKGEQDYLLMANSARGVMKMKLSQSDIDATDAIKSRISGTAGLSYETVEELEDVAHLDKLGADHAVLLVSNESDDTIDLRTIDLP